MFSTLPTGLHHVVIGVTQSDLEVGYVAHEELPERNVPAIESKRLLGVASARLEVGREALGGEPFLGPWPDCRVAVPGVSRLMVIRSSAKKTPIDTNRAPVT